MNINKLVIIYNIRVINIKAKCELLSSWNHTQNAVAVESIKMKTN